MFTLLITSLVVLSTTEVKVVPLTERVLFKTWTACKEAEKEVRAMGVRYQARCVKEMQ